MNQPDPSPQTPRKYSAEDLFGDILSDLEGTPRPVTAPAAPAPAAPGVLETVPEPPESLVTVPGPPPADQEEATAPAGAPAPAGWEIPAPAEPERFAWQEPESFTPAEPALEQFGNYDLLERVAVGGMAELFKARQRGVQRSDQIVAIKRILPHLSDNDEFVRMFIDEAKLAAQLSHPNIVQIFDLGKAGGSYYIAMEYVDGRDLRSLLRKVREYKLPVPERLAASIIMKVASALDYAHRKRAIDDKELRLVHRDISPQNILISFDGVVKLVDFGIAKAANKSAQTQSGALKGKLLYMSPEQALSQPLDGRSDLYSLGLVLAELLTGERCFQADSELGVLEKVRMGKVVPARMVNPNLSREMGTILDKALQKDMDLRYASARLLERDLKELLAERGAEPGNGELADYVHTMLKGTREEVEALLAARYPVPSAGPAAPPAVQTATAPAGPARRLEDAPTLPGVDTVTLAPAPAAVPHRARRQVRPGLVVAFLAVAAAAAAWLLLR